MSSPTLWRHPGFLRLWAGETASQFGEQFGNLAIPVIAVSVLGASSFEVGLLNTAETLAFLVIGLPAGAWIDRWIKRRVMLRADLVRAVLLALVPVLWFTQVLAFWQLLVIGTAVGICSVFFDVGYQSFIPTLVRREQIAEANGKLETTAQIARIAGPAAAGGLLTILAAPLLLAVTAVTYLASFFALTTIADTETPKPAAERRPLAIEIREGLVWVFRQPLLVRIVLCTALSNLFGTIALTMMPVLVLRELHLSPAVYGLIGSAGAVGGLLGAAMSSRISRRIGEGHAIPAAALLGGVAMLVLPLSTVWTPAAIPVLIGSEFFFSAAVLVYNIAQVSFRQRICPPELLGRMNASIRFIVWGVMPLGGFASGLLSVWIGVVPTVWVGVVGNLLGAMPVVFSALWMMRTLPTTANGVGGAGEPPASSFEPGAEPESARPTDPLA
ncbi:MFS transporter [Lysinimonas soli]|uniref:MFS transporter n=1 Tax=Lysinimonas soli TaxID=1074233 RepID=A0ABW0NMQ7_9MICO